MLTAYIMQAIVVLLVLTPIAGIIIFIKGVSSKKKGLKSNYLLEWNVALLIIYFIILAMLTLIPVPITNGGALKISLIPFVDIINGIRGITTANPMYAVMVFVSNILLFVPLGFLLSIYLEIKKRLNIKYIVIAGITVSVLIEVSQLMFSLGRTTNVDDIISNTSGAVIGYFLAKVIIKIVYKKIK